MAVEKTAGWDYTSDVSNSHVCEECARTHCSKALYPATLGMQYSKKRCRTTCTRSVDTSENEDATWSKRMKVNGCLRGIRELTLGILETRVQKRTSARRTYAATTSRLEGAIARTRASHIATCADNWDSLRGSSFRLVVSFDRRTVLPKQLLPDSRTFEIQLAHEMSFTSSVGQREKFLTAVAQGSKYFALTAPCN